MVPMAAAIDNQAKRLSVGEIIRHYAGSLL